ncbi:MAG: 5-formyltetrahydrofolate cyclo-ligase [Gammaproteobacteria bacterium]
MERRKFRTKAEARQAVWDALVEARVARFPFPTHGRIPNFEGAREAAEHLLAHPLFHKVRCVKVNPDSPQKPVREALLRRGVMVLVPTPRLKGGFRTFDPAKIPADKISEAASLGAGARWGEEVALEALPPVDLIVTGSVAVTRDGHRCGKGHGYGDLEYAILKELGQPPVPIVTTVHAMQVVEDLRARWIPAGLDLAQPFQVAWYNLAVADACRPRFGGRRILPRAGWPCNGSRISPVSRIFSQSHLNVHATYGPWIALRVAVVIDIEGPSGPPPEPPNPLSRLRELPRFREAIATSGATPARHTAIEQHWPLWLPSIRHSAPVLLR